MEKVLWILSVTLSCCVCVCRISLGGKGNALYPVLSGLYFDVTLFETWSVCCRRSWFDGEPNIVPHCRQWKHVAIVHHLLAITDDRTFVLYVLKSSLSNRSCFLSWITSILFIMHLTECHVMRHMQSVCRIILLLIGGIYNTHFCSYIHYVLACSLSLLSFEIVSFNFFVIFFLKQKYGRHAEFCLSSLQNEFPYFLWHPV